MAAKRDRTVKPCRRCGGEKLSGQGQKLCAACRELSIAEGATRVGPVMPCHKCGGTEGKRPGRQLCDECKRLNDEASLARKRHRRARQRKRCPGCGGEKGSGNRRYCDRCKAEREGPRNCIVCGERKVTQKWAMACDDCKEKSVVRRRERQADYARRKRAQKRKEGKAASAPYVSTKRGRETARMRYRVNRIKNGYTVPLAPEKKATAHDPIVLTVKFREQFDKFKRTCPDGGAIELLEARSGVAERIIGRKIHEEEVMTVDLADKLLMGLGLSFPIVYDNDDVIPRRVWNEYIAMRNLIDRARGF